MTNLNNIVEILAKQALGNDSKSQTKDGLSGVLGSILNQFGGVQQSAQGGLGGILSTVLSQFGGTQQTDQKSTGTAQLLIAVVPLILAWIQQQDGLQGALDKLKASGLASQVEDWVSTADGENIKVDPQQVQSLFNHAEVEKVAEQVNTAKQDVYSAISTVLPQIIDALTPQGTQTNNSEANTDIKQVLEVISKFLK